MALAKLRRAATLATKVPEIKPAITAAIAAFDASLPSLKTMRDVAEHIDDYAIDDGRDSAIRRQALEVGAIRGCQIKWLGLLLDAKQALVASEALFLAIRSNSPKAITKG